MKQEATLAVHVTDEVSQLREVVVGSASKMGPVPAVHEAYDPKSRQHILEGTFPLEEDLNLELESLVSVLERYDVVVRRPETIANCNQVFARDIGFVIDSTFVIPHILPNRDKEFLGIQSIVESIPDENVIEVADDVRIEGGDVMPWGDKILVGYSAEPDFEKYIVSRTNQAGVDFLKSAFPGKEVISFQLNKSDTNPRENALHLDCCFQPIGGGRAIIYKGGFKSERELEAIYDIFGMSNLIFIDREEMYEMNSNIFSISPEVIVTDITFTRLNDVLRGMGYKLEEVMFREVAKMEGLFRCTTLPLIRD